jgi:hypothetical protein
MEAGLLALDHGFARRAFQGVLDVWAQAVVRPERQRAHPRRRVVDALGDEGAIDFEGPRAVLHIARKKFSPSAPVVLAATASSTLSTRLTRVMSLSSPTIRYGVALARRIATPRNSTQRTLPSLCSRRIS